MAESRIKEEASEAEEMRAMQEEGRGEVAYIIGGTLGLAPEVLQRAWCRLSFSRMTFPHQMMRVILLEQTLTEG